MKERNGKLYMCPMDGFQSDQPIECPMCGMKLMPKDEATHHQQRFIEDPGAMMAAHPVMAMYKWVQSAVLVLGLWLVTQPMAFDYQSRALMVSDILSGALAMGIAAATLLAPQRAWISYANAFVGLWLMFAPLAFWSPTPAGYLLDTLIGALLITFSFVIPMTMEMPGPEVPPGWTYNPSTWVQRAPIIALGLVGYFLARPMAGFQLGHVHSIWEPFFGEGTRRVLTSDVSKAWPVSDAGLGAMTYLIEVLSTFMGDRRRWRTMPWMVAIFGIAVIPLGVTSIVLVIMQPIVVGHWCTLCLITAAAMLLMVPLALDEVVAMIQFLNHSRKTGKSIWRTFWRGGSLPDATDRPMPHRESTWRLEPMLWGVTGSWSLYAGAALGIWLLFAPAVFGSTAGAADSDHLVGALAVTCAMIALAEVGRAMRFLNIGFGAWLAAAPWFLSGASSAAQWNSAVAGVLLIALSLPLGKIRDHYGTFGPYVVWPRSGARPWRELRRQPAGRAR